MRFGYPALALVGLIISVATMTDRDKLFHRSQVTYCKLLTKKNVYRRERLDVFCTIKAKLFDDMVSFYRRSISRTPLLVGTSIAIELLNVNKALKVDFEPSQILI